MSVNFVTSGATTMVASSATSPMEIKRQFLERALNAPVALSLKRKYPRIQFEARKRSFAKFLKKCHSYDHSHYVPGFVSFETTHPNPVCTDWLNLHPGEETCQCEDMYNFLEHWRIETLMKEHFSLDPPFPKSGSGPYVSRPIQADELAPIPSEFDELLVGERIPESKRNLERKARCDTSLKALEYKWKQKELLPTRTPFPKPGTGPYASRASEKCELAHHDKYEFCFCERLNLGSNLERMLERNARCEASVKALAEHYPGGWKMGPGIPDDRPEPMVFSRNRYELLNSEDDMSSMDNISESDDDDDEDEECVVVEQDKLYEADDEDESFVISNKIPTPYFETEEKSGLYILRDEIDRSYVVVNNTRGVFFGDELWEFEFSLLRDDGDDETVYPPSVLDPLFEAIVPLLHDQSSKFYDSEYYDSFGVDDGFGDEEEHHDISSGASLHIFLQF